MVQHGKQFSMTSSLPYMIWCYDGSWHKSDGGLPQGLSPKWTDTRQSLITIITPTDIVSS